MTGDGFGHSGDPWGAGDERHPMNDTGPDDEKAIHARLVLLRQEHQDLDAAIYAIEQQPLPDQLLLMRLKRKKLSIRDQIVMLEDQLTPDIIA